MGYDLESKGFCIYLPNKQLNEMLYSTRKMYSPKVTMSLFQVMFCLRGREIKSSSILRILQRLMMSNSIIKSSQIQNHKSLISPNQLPTPFHSINLKNLNSRHQIAHQLLNQIWAVDIDPIMHLVTMKG